MSPAALLCPFKSGEGFRGSSGIWETKEWKSQATIRAGVSLSLTFLSVGDDIQVYMGNGRVINEREKEHWGFLQGTQISAAHLRGRAGDAPM